MAKDYIQPAKNRPALPKRVPQAALDISTTKLDTTKEFDLLTAEVHRGWNKILFDTEAAYRKACGELGVTPTARKEVIVL
jgi:hypothetical protein